MKELVDFTKKCDNGKHLVTYAPRADIAENHTFFDLSFSDVISSNHYSFFSSPPSQNPFDTDYIENHLNVLSTGYPTQPIFISESGWHTNGALNFTEADQSSYIEAHWNYLENYEAVVGVTFFEFSDEWWKGGDAGTHDSNLEEHNAAIAWTRKQLLARTRRGQCECETMVSA